MPGTSGAKAIAIDDAHFYWVEESGGVFFASKAGGAVNLVASGQSVSDSPSIGADADAVYWTTSIAVIKASKTTKALTTVASSQNKPRSIALDGTSIFWIAGKSVLRASKAGGSTVTIATELSAPEQVKVDASGVYWVVFGTNELRYVPHTGGQPITINSEYAGPRSLALDEEWVYVAEEGSDPGFNNGLISRVAKAGGPKTVLASTQAYPGWLDVDSADAYWANFNGSAVLKTAKNGTGAPLRVAESPSPTMVVVLEGDQYVWWVGANGISKVAK